jgi:hypothetical protein
LKLNNDLSSSFIYKPLDDGPSDRNMLWLKETVKLIEQMARLLILIDFIKVQIASFCVHCTVPGRFNVISFKGNKFNKNIL